MRKLLATLVLLLLGSAFVSFPVYSATGPNVHRVVIQVDANDPAIMNLALNNAQNIVNYFNDKQQDIKVEIVADGPGLNMLRADTSPVHVQERIRQLSENSLPAVRFSACGHTRAVMEKAEGKPIPIVKDATVVPSGVVRVMELQEQGWNYLKP
ncbi:MAG: DsrE family protein [Casimicrobiaceae bacterium]